MKQNCYLCGALLFEHNIDSQTGLAHCPDCHAIFSVNLPQNGKPALDTIDMPKGFTSTRDDDGLHLIYRWRKGSLPVQVLSVALINIFVLWWLADAFNQRRIDLAALGLVFLAFGIWTIASLLLTLFNRTHIRVSLNQLTVRSGPFSISSSQAMPREQIKQVYVVQFKNGTGRHRRISYRVQAALFDYPDMVIVPHLGDSTDALYIEQQIERFLSLRDVRVAGEFARGAY